MLFVKLFQTEELAQNNLSSYFNIIILRHKRLFPRLSLSLSLFACLSVFLWLSLSLFFCLSFFIYVSLPVCLSVCLSVSLSLSLSLCIFLNDRFVGNIIYMFAQSLCTHWFPKMSDLQSACHLHFHQNKHHSRRMH